MVAKKTVEPELNNNENEKDRKLFSIDFDPAGQEKFKKILVSDDFIRLSQYTSEDDIPLSDTIPILNQLRLIMLALYGDDGYKKLKKEYDGDLTQMWAFTQSKLPDTTAQALT